jgi:hypothetical protein
MLLVGRVALPILVSAAALAACSMVNNPAVPGSSFAQSAYRGGTPAYKIYVANIGDQTITTYEPDGTQTTPTISTATYLFAIAVDPNGKIYALTFNPLSGPSTAGTVSSYKPDGMPTTPTITIPELGFSGPSGIAVDRAGKIYVLSSAHDGTRGTVTTYKPDGAPTKPTFRTGPDSNGITIDGNGKIYVTNDTGPNGKSSVTTYLPDGTPTTPTITHDIHQPAGIAVTPDGTIFVVNNNNRGHDGTEAGYVTSYTAEGAGPLHLIRYRNQAPGAIAEANVTICVASSSAYTSTIKTYTLGGRRISPTITAGVYEPSGLAIH